MSEEVKSKNFYLMDIIQNLKLGWSISDMPFILDMSKQNVQYYVNILKNEGIIVKRGYGTWEVKKEVKNFSVGTRPSTNLHSLNIQFPILSGTIRDSDWAVKEKLKNWIPKYKGLDNLGGLTIKNNNNKSITVYIHQRDILSLEEVDNLAFKVRAFIAEYFRKEGVILDVMNCITKNINMATQEKGIKGALRKGEVFEMDLNKKAEPIFPKDNINAKAWLDNSPKPNSVESNDKEWKREYLSMPFRIRDMFGIIEAQLQLLDVQTRSTASLAQNIESHIPSWMSNIKVEQELKKLRRTISTHQKKLSDY